VQALYIGIQTPGTTAQLRGAALKRLLPQANWIEIDTDSAFLHRPRWQRTLAFRLRTGPAVSAINHLIRQKLDSVSFDLIWVDKGVYLWPDTIKELRRLTEVLIHYTPDTAFFANQSRFFEATIDLYDKVVTTKSFELDHYRNRVSDDRLILATQSYDEQLHRMECNFLQKRNEVVLVGLCEPDREHCVDALLKQENQVRIGGRGWERFVSAHANNPLFHFEGAAIFGQHYVQTLSRAALGLGLLTKQFPELHTTRTFEIPACGTALATVRNAETTAFFTHDEAVFYETYEDLAHKAKTLLNSPAELQKITEAGHRRVRNGAFSNEQVLARVLKEAGLTGL
jgi:spore maturation protein CgeB